MTQQIVTNPTDFLVPFLATYSDAVKFLAMFEDGRVFLSHGDYEYKFTTKAKPSLVWLAEVDGGNMPVCHGSPNTFGVRLLDDGFVLIARVETETSELLWQAFLASPES